MPEPFNTGAEPVNKKYIPYTNGPAWPISNVNVSLKNLEKKGLSSVTRKQHTWPIRMAFPVNRWNALVYIDLLNVFYLRSEKEIPFAQYSSGLLYSGWAHEYF